MNKETKTDTPKTPRLPRGARRELLLKSQKYLDLMEACAAYVAVCAPAILDPEAAYAFMRPLIEKSDSINQESFYVILLNGKSRVIGSPIECTRGLANSTPVHPREVFCHAVRLNATSIVLCHNHPSGDPTPSQEDIAVTRRLIEAGKIIGIHIADHIVIGRPNSGTYAGYFSFRESGVCSFTD